MTTAFTAALPLCASHSAIASACAPTRRGASYRAAPVRLGASMSASTRRQAPPITSAAAPTRSYRHDDRIVLYDGVCGLCSRAVQWLLEADGDQKLKFAALQSDVGLQILAETGAPDDLSTMVFVEAGKAHTHSEAVLRIGEQLPLYGSAALLARMVLPRLLRDAFYTHILANNRYWIFGQSDSCMLFQPGHEERFLK